MIVLAHLTSPEFSVCALVFVAGLMTGVAATYAFLKRTSY